MKWARRPAGRGHGWESSPEGGTTASLAIRKASGIKLGNPINIQAAGEVGRKSLIDVADEHARSMLPLLRTLRSEGTITIAAVTQSLNFKQHVKEQPFVAL